MPHGMQLYLSYLGYYQLGLASLPRIQPRRNLSRSVGLGQERLSGSARPSSLASGFVTNRSVQPRLRQQRRLG